MPAYVYILTNRENTVLYTGVTNILERRLAEHKSHFAPGFSDKYNVQKLLWYSEYADIRTAIESEKKIKNRGRQWKINLIEKNNPRWIDLSEQCYDFRDSAMPKGSQNDENGSTQSSFCA